MGIAASYHRSGIPSGLNTALTGLVAAANLVLFLGVPLLLAAGDEGAVWLILPALLATIMHWALIHEAVHGHLHVRPGINEGAGRLLAVFFLAPFDTLRFGHLSHHALNARAAERAEFYDPLLRSRLRAVTVFYLRLVCGIYLLEVGSGLLSLLPRPLLRPIVRRVFYEGEPEARNMAERAERMLLALRTLWRIRLEAVVILALLTGSLLAYGDAWPLLLTALLGRAFIISLMDNAPHYDGPLADPEQGFDMRLPRLLMPLVLNANLHGTHHRHPNLAWMDLPTAFDADGTGYDGSYLIRPWRQLRGPVPLATPADR